MHLCNHHNREEQLEGLAGSSHLSMATGTLGNALRLPIRGPNGVWTTQEGIWPAQPTVRARVAELMVELAAAGTDPLGPAAVPPRVRAESTRGHVAVDEAAEPGAVSVTFSADPNTLPPGLVRSTLR